MIYELILILYIVYLIMAYYFDIFNVFMKKHEGKKIDDMSKETEVIIMSFLMIGCFIVGLIIDLGMLVWMISHGLIIARYFLFIIVGTYCVMLLRSALKKKTTVCTTRNWKGTFIRCLYFICLIIISAIALVGV